MISDETENLKHALARTRRVTRSAVKDLRAEAMKLGEMAKMEFHELVGDARSTGREQLTQLGRELVKLGRKLESIARQPPARARRRAASQPVHSDVRHA